MEDLLSYTENLILEQSEKELIEEAKRDPRKFEPLYDKYYKQLFLFLLNRHGDKQETADIMSQVFLKALTKLDQFTYKGHPLSSWLYRIAINESNKIFRKKSKTRFISIDHELGDQLADELHVSENRYAKLKEVLKELKPKEVQLIELRFFESMSFKEVGEVLNITENNAKVRVYRVLDKMRIKMKGYEK